MTGTRDEDVRGQVLMGWSRQNTMSSDLLTTRSNSKYTSQYTHTDTVK